MRQPSRALLVVCHPCSTKVSPCPWALDPTLFPPSFGLTLGLPLVRRVSLSSFSHQVFFFLPVKWE